jgi:antitoxin (DNA-binding transcriptional repressor) of toxin-antitoxin stability system
VHEDAVLLDAVENGERFAIIRRGKAVAHLVPLHRGRGSEVKALLREHRPDPEWPGELHQMRRELLPEERF